MKLIGAGLPRTATTTQKVALEMLGLPCYHMRELLTNMEEHVPLWDDACEGRTGGALAALNEWWESRPTAS
jgi:hypothetical protein